MRGVAGFSVCDNQHPITPRFPPPFLAYFVVSRSDPALCCLEANFVNLVHGLVTFIERHWDALMADLRAGTITGECEDNPSAG